MTRLRLLIVTVLQRLLAALGLLASAPVLLIASLAIVAESGRPVLFRQQRVGKDSREFTLFKLRSMRTNNQGPHITAAADVRPTRVGSLLRSYKLDELPQLWNIVLGDMSFVGPRPEIPRYVDSANPAWRDLLSVRPGITDLASIVFRHEEKMFPEGVDVEQFYCLELLPKKLALSTFYLRTRSLRRDLRLIAVTLRYSLYPAGFDPAAIASRFGYSLHL
jgi:lipopolysaccharide/colanic/teichoic acid biosynthesis glycosyltransferase